MLTVELRDAHAESLAGEVDTALAASALVVEHTITDGGEGRVALEFSLPAESNLGPLLAALGVRLRISRVEMRPLRLHEIYVRAVRADQGEPEPAAAQPGGTHA